VSADNEVARWSNLAREVRRKIPLCLGVHLDAFTDWVAQRSTADMLERIPLEG